MEVGEPSSCLQAFWSVDEVQVASVFDTKDEKWARIRCNSGLLQGGAPREQTPY